MTGLNFFLSDLLMETLRNVKTETKILIVNITDIKKAARNVKKRLLAIMYE